MLKDPKKILSDWRDEVTRSLVEGFRQLFDSSSEVLLDFADAAENNRLQRLFYDAQREFYLKEEVIVGEFERNLREQLLQSLDKVHAAAKPGAETLSLVEVEDYERSLALETIAQRVLKRQLGELHALSQRLSALIGGRPVPVEQVPANPLQVIRIFDPASRKLELDKEVRLVFYTLFDRYVMSRLGALYTALNERLIELGVLPNIRYTYQRSAATSRPRPESTAPRSDSSEDAGNSPASQSAAAGDGPAQVRQLRPSTPTSGETLSAISSLLMAKRQRQAVGAAHSAALDLMPTAASVNEAINDARVLRDAPHPIPLSSGPAPAKVAIDAALLLKVKKALEKQRLIIKGLVGQERLDRREEDVIDIVGMLFEAMLNEKLLPNAVKTLLSHLHTRYLKIAVQSEDFLENAAHPARRLFERLLDAGIRWVREDNLRAGIYPQLQAIVTQVLDNENPGDSFFIDKIAQLDAYEERLEKHSHATEERTLEAERGRARLEQAKGIVQQTLGEISAGADLPEAVSSFLATTFADYLTLLLLRSSLDTDSPAWGNAFNLGEALVAAAVHTAAGRALTPAVKTDLLQRLESSVSSLIPHHEQNIRRVIDSLDSVDRAAARPTEVPAAQSPSLGAFRSQGAAATPPADSSVAPATVDEDDRRLADKLMRSTGDWFVMPGTDDAEEQAVKLLWVNPHTRNMLFVDQQGAKVALLPAEAVARRIRLGSVRPMRQEASSFVARSLRRIRRALEDSVNA